MAIETTMILMTQNKKRSMSLLPSEEATTNCTSFQERLCVVEDTERVQDREVMEFVGSQASMCKFPLHAQKRTQMRKPMELVR